MAKLLKLRRGTTSQHSSFTGAEGEVTVDTTKDTLVVHDGSTAGGHAVAAEDMANVSSANIVGRLGTGSIVKAKLEADIIDSTKLADDSVNSEHYVDGSIDTAHIADAQVTHVKLSNDCIDGDNIQDDVVNSEHIAAGAVDLEHMSSESVDEDNLKISNSGSNGQFLSKQSGDAGGLTWAAVDLSPYAPLAAPALTGTATGVNLTLSGNLTVNGTTTTVATTNTTLTDNLLELNSGAGSNANDAGILIERGSTGDNAIIAWDESADKFTVGTTTGTASSTGNISITTGTLVANVEGNLSGQASALSGSRTIGGVVFDNTADINLPGVNTGGNQNTTGSAATLTTPRAINGTNFDGSAAITVTAAAGTLTGGTLASGVTASSLTSVGTLTGLTVSGAVSTGDLTVLDPTPDLKLQDSNHTGNSTEHTIYFKDSTGANQMNIGSPTGEQHLRIKHDTTELIKIQTDGKVGIGTTSPTQLLELNGASTPSVQVKDTTNNVICRVGADDTSVLLGGRSNHAVKIYQNDATAVTIDTSKNTTFAGTVSDSKGDVRKIVQNYQTGAYTLVVGDAGKCITITTGGVTVNQSIFAAGDAVTIINHSGSDQTITQGSSFTLHNAADAATGNRTLAGRGMATIWFENVNEAYISGAGLS